MKKLGFIIVLVLALSFCTMTAFAKDVKLSDFSDGFESYAVDGKHIEENTEIIKKWENNVLKGGENQGIDTHIKGVAKIAYENGESGNKVLRLKNTIGGDTFFYLGPSNDFRVKNFTAGFKVKFLVSDVLERSWVGLSFRKRANIHYTGTNNLLFTIQRYKATNVLTVHPYVVNNGGSPADLTENMAIYGDLLNIEKSNYTVPDSVGGDNMDWVNVKYAIKDKNYKMYLNDTLVMNVDFGVDNFDYFGYMSLNACQANLMIDDFYVNVDDTALPPVIEKLSAPIISLDTENKRIAWKAMSGASTYGVKVNDKEEEYVSTTSFKLNQLTAAGVYKISVRALSDDTFEFKDSDYSEEVTYTIEGSGGDLDSGCKKKATAQAILVVSSLSTLMLAGLFIRK